ncbi:MAG: MFS transporter [Bacteroidales bacterium]|nr:MFS transporter [Bacteroidales bacterium]
MKSFFRRPDLLTFFCLYLAQSLPMTFFSTALQVTMRQASFSLSAIAMLQVIKLPWVLKFLWSPWVDRRCNTLQGFRRCIFVSEGIYAAIILVVGLLDLQLHFPLVIGLIFLSFVASATQDIATDALAVLSFGHREKGLVNSMQSLGSFCATLLGSGVLLALLQRYGWNYILPCLALFVVVALVPLYRNRTLTIAPKQHSEPVRWTSIVSFFARREIWPQVGFLALSYAGLIGMLSMLRPWMVDLGYDMQEIGMWSGIAGSAAACVASLLSGRILVRWGRRTGRILFAAVSCFTALFFLLVQWMGPTHMWVVPAVMMLWFSYGLSTVVVYTTAMDHVRPGLEGTDFTMQTVITHLSGIVVALVCGHVAEAWGYVALFACCALITLCTLAYNCKKSI